VLRIGSALGVRPGHRGILLGCEAALAGIRVALQERASGEPRREANEATARTLLAGSMIDGVIGGASSPTWRSAAVCRNCHPVPS